MKGAPAPPVKARRGLAVAAAEPVQTAAAAAAVAGALQNGGGAALAGGGGATGGMGRGRGTRAKRQRLEEGAISGMDADLKVLVL